MTFFETTAHTYEDSLCKLDSKGCDGFRLPYKRSRSSEEDSSDVLALTAKELNSLPVQEREKMFEEVHGIQSKMQEDPEVVSKCLSSFDEEIERVNVDKSAYKLALSMRPELKFDRKFRLMFLRADCFDVRKAARRMIAHFDTKRLLFGADKLAKKITLDDLAEEDRIQSVNGYMQFLPSKDQAGRTLLFINVKRATALSWESKFRILWYRGMELLEAEDVQKKGFVIISYYVGCQAVSDSTRQTIRNYRFQTDSLPCKIVGVHFCYDRPELRPFVLLTQHAMGMKYRIRCRAHLGSDIECQYKLMTFGIPQSILPIDSSGEYRETEFEKQTDRSGSCGQRKSKGSTSDSMTSPVQANALTTTVRSSDVLLGKGVNQSHLANAQLLKFILRRRHEYEAASKFEKTCIAMSIVDTINKSGGRFMRRKQGSDKWMEVSNIEARKSVVGRFRMKGTTLG